MKKILLLANIFIVTLVLTSCQFSESLYINEDGSGKVSFEFNGDEFMKMGGDMLGEQQQELKEKAMDTVIVFKDFLEEKKDSIAQLPIEDQEKLKRLENFKMHMVMDEMDKRMMFDMYSEFDNVSELGDVFNTFKTASTAGNALKTPGATMGGADPMSATKEEDYSKVHYSFEKNTFKRYTEILDEEKLKQSTDSLSQMKMFLSGSNYKLQYHFPRRIKKVSNEKALFSQDGKSFVLEIGFMEFMENPKALDIMVELEE